MTAIEVKCEEVSLDDAAIPIKNFVVAAIVVGDQVQLIDRHGRALTAMIDRTLLGRFRSCEATRNLNWLKALGKHLNCIRKEVYAATKNTGWTNKCATFSASVRRRRCSTYNAGSRQRHEGYDTHDWKAAIKRLWHQGNNRHRKLVRGPWHQWSATVSNNHNKKKGGRYAKN